MHWLSLALLLSLPVPILVSLLRGRSACQWTVVWNFGVFLTMVAAELAGGLYGRVVLDLGLDTGALGQPAQWYRALSAMYVHAGALHVLMNMLILTLIGVPFEDRVGAPKWLALYLISGLMGAVVDAGFAAASGSRHIGVGASGAIFGVMGAFAVLYPRDEIPMVLGVVFLQRVPVFAAVIVMAILETLYLAVAARDNIGHLVHMASLVAGVALAIPVSRLGGEGGRPGKELDARALRELAVDEAMAQLVERVVGEDVPEVRSAWMEELIKRARCPKCRRALGHARGRFTCRCGFKVEYMR
ncbi:MAG: rhomboid family intramembrane serine protease [Thermoplasmatota archaeon]